jgi:hypothetical protein
MCTVTGPQATGSDNRSREVRKGISGPPDPNLWLCFPFPSSRLMGCKSSTPKEEELTLYPVANRLYYIVPSQCVQRPPKDSSDDAGSPTVTRVGADGAPGKVLACEDGSNQVGTVITLEYKEYSYPAPTQLWAIKPPPLSANGQGANTHTASSVPARRASEPAPAVKHEGARRASFPHTAGSFYGWHRQSDGHCSVVCAAAPSLGLSVDQQTVTRVSAGSALSIPGGCSLQKIHFEETNGGGTNPTGNTSGAEAESKKTWSSSSSGGLPLSCIRIEPIKERVGCFAIVFREPPVEAKGEGVNEGKTIALALAVSQNRFGLADDLMVCRFDPTDPQQWFNFVRCKPS